MSKNSLDFKSMVSSEVQELKLSEIGRHPLLQPSQIQGVLHDFNQKSNNYVLGQIMPLVNRPVDKVKMDVELVIRGGMTPMVAMGSSTPIYGAHARAQVEFEAAEFREKVVLNETDIYNLRRIGTEADLVDARSYLRQNYSVIEERLQNRLEWMRREVLFYNSVKSKVHNGADFEIQYKHPAFLRPQLLGNDRWSQYTTSDPIQVLQVWVEDFVRYTGFRVARIVLPLGMFRHLSQNAKFRDTATNSYGAFNGGRDAIIQHIVNLVGVGNIEEWDASLSFSVELAADASASQAVVNLADASQLEAGDKILMYNPQDGSYAQGIVGSVTGNAVTLTANLAAALPKGSTVRFAKQTVPTDRILILGEAPNMMSQVGSQAGGADASMVSNWAELTSTLSGYVDLNNRRPGLFSKNIDKTNGDPPSLEQVIGIRALPNVHYSLAWMSPTVL
jgi:hypothetical protein